MHKIGRMPTMGRSKAPVPTPPPEALPQSACTRLHLSKLPLEDRAANLAQTVCQCTLPVAIRLTKTWVGKAGSPIALKNGEILLLCSVEEVSRVHGTTGKGTDYHLPLYANQLYHKLPIDPMLDNKVYRGTKALIEAKPLPDAIRIVDAEWSADPMAFQNMDDIIFVRRVETQTHPERGKERVLIGTDPRGEEVHYSEAMDLATYSTKLFGDPMPMSELVRYDMPQRVQMVPLNSEDGKKTLKPKSSKNEVMKLHRLNREYHVIAARGGANELLSLPLNLKVDFQVIDASVEDVRDCLSSVLSRTNTTWAVTDVTQPRLPLPLCAVPQPEEAVFTTWALSYEGKERINQYSQHNVAALIDRIGEQQSTIRQLEKISQRPASMQFTPGRDRPSLTGEAPPRPPKPLDNRASISGPVVSRRPPTLPKPGKKRNDDPVIKEMEDGQKASEADSTIKALKQDIYDRDQTIYELRVTERRLKEDCERLRKEKADAQTSQAADRGEILRLQREIDRLVNAQSGAVYETLDDIGATDHNIYSTPYTGTRLTKDMPVKDVLDFLREVGLPQYCKTFQEESVDGSLLFALDEEIMTGDLGMRRLDARKLHSKLALKSKLHGMPPSVAALHGGRRFSSDN